MNAISRTPVFSLFSETLNGLATIRAFKKVEEFIRIDYKVLNQHAKVFLYSYLTDRWLSIRLDVLSVLISGAVAFLGAGLRNYFPPGILALSLTYSTLLVGILQYSTRLSIEIENNMTSVERLIHFSQIQPEAPPRVYDMVIPKSWPEQGKIEFRNLKARYRPELDLVLNGISFVVNPGEKIGVCGRTGSGKSSLMLALFRVIEPEERGSIIIDGIDIQSVGLKDVREKLCIIPQDPVLLSGSVRFNLDVNAHHFVI
jgi:ABC-type multidrug transport system fused ATPase/permease subunit